MIETETITSGFITQQGLKELSNYKYKSGGYTKLDLKMNIFWEWCVSLLPLWVAPNLITFIGWIAVILSYVILLIHDTTGQGDVPSWCFFLTAFCIFVYSTLDAIDGKQARRTGSSSPLGQLFDHGCDSFSMTFFVLAICQGCRLSDTEVIYLIVAAQLTFWTSNWVEYHTGVLRTKVGQFGVTQSQFVCLLLHVITGFMGQSFWGTTLGNLGILSIPQQFHYIRISTIINCFFATLLILLSIYSVISTILSLPNKFQGASQYLSLILILVMEVLWMSLSIYPQYQGLILLNFGILVSTLACKIIICSVTKMKLEAFHNEIIPFLIASMLMMLLQLQENNGRTMIVVLWLSLIINLVGIGKFLYQTINQLTQHLGIYCFSLQKKQKLKIK